MSQAAASNARPAYLIAADEIRDNPGQWKAYESRGNCIILAGPGSGKTKTITIKMARILAEDVRQPRGVACVTYSSECAREVRRRLDRLGIQEVENVFVGTVHSFCLRHVVMPYGRLAGLELPAKIAIASPIEQDKLFERALALEISADEPPFRWKTRFDEYRRTHLDRDSAGRHEDNDLSRLIDRYEQLLRGEQLLDFDDMVLFGLQLIESNSWVRKAIQARFPVLIVDEYQDLGVPLHRIVLNLCFKDPRVRLLAVGDPDQSIYGFIGAHPELFRELSQAGGIERVVLPFNYRSGAVIVAASEVALGERRSYKAKSDQASTIDFYECPEGIESQAELICHQIIPDALKRRKGRCLGDVAVLYLDKYDGNVIARQAAAAGINFIRIDGGAPYRKTPLTRWLEDCADWCSGGWRIGVPRLSNLINIWLEFNLRKRGDREICNLRRTLVYFLLSHRTPTLLLRDWLGALQISCLDETLKMEPTLKDEAEAFRKLIEVGSEDGEWQGITIHVFAGQVGSPEHLNLITLHSAKGLEFDVVVMMGMDQGRIPSWATTTDAAKREPRRLFYVGLTRARHEVHMTYSGWTANRYGRRFENGPSEFLLDVKRKLSEISSAR